MKADYLEPHVYVNDAMPNNCILPSTNISKKSGSAVVRDTSSSAMSSSRIEVYLEALITSPPYERGQSFHQR